MTSRLSAPAPCRILGRNMPLVTLTSSSGYLTMQANIMQYRGLILPGGDDHLVLCVFVTAPGRDRGGIVINEG